MTVQAPEAPLRELTNEEVAAYREDGAIRASGLFSEEWVARITEAVDYVLANPSVLAQATADFSEGKANGDAFMWKTHEAFRDFVFRSPASRVAQRLFGSQTVTAFYDQVFTKPRGTAKPTPFHEDATSFPIDGDQVCAMWIALDHCGPETAALTVVRGSHRWERDRAPVTSSLMHRAMQAGRTTPESGTTTRSETTPESGAGARSETRRDVLTWDERDLLAWDLAPGDAVIFHPAALHGSTGTAPAHGRRAFVSRWLGDGVTFQPKKGVMPILWDPGLEPGQPMGGPLFPRVLPTVDFGAGKGADQWEAQQPDPERLGHFLRRIGRG
ncbi:phytanoyl-CoA dioxygenase family protein [Streptomyces sp. S465]|uniref:phytanoyl-CoA dioxygenase family protein n=1 Tax=Streptomyces sp. S465 TaxID=2979468 RepID=UPI0022A85A2C|nr:phytanoyl-CoA dioxygenase family protein [Streptomyces sp. S465]WAP57582.1 phytanoyl-CoA dioxygenase family protein [Streptomyces sp. S465]